MPEGNEVRSAVFVRRDLIMKVPMSNTIYLSLGIFVICDIDPVTRWIVLVKTPGSSCSFGERFRVPFLCGFPDWE
jgi:hypothetical protein